MDCRHGWTPVAPRLKQPVASPAQAQPVAIKPPSHFLWGIVATLLCCLPAGIVSLVYAGQVEGKWAAGDHAGALAASNNAKTWAWVSFGLGLVVMVIYALAGLVAS